MAESPPLVVLLHPDSELLGAALRHWRQTVEFVVYEDVATALAQLRDREVALFVADLRAQHAGAEGWVRKAAALKGSPEMLVLLGPGEELSARIPSEGILHAPVDHEILLAQADRLLALQQVRRRSGIVGTSPQIRELLSTVAQVAPLDVPVLVNGESGTGKEMVARALHEGSQRADKPFLSINAGSLAETLLESELFGHEKGAFTGAVALREGLFERAHKGTLFLDELGEMSPAMQVKLLRVLETQEFQRVGGTSLQRSDVRLIAATHRDLEREMAAGRFRADLYYRLKVVKIEIPPLRARPDDILVLAQHFLEEANEKHGLRRRGFTVDALQRLRRYAWPGNVRELRNVISSMAVLGAGELLDIDDMPSELREGAAPRPALPVTAGEARGDDTRDGALWTSTLLALAADVRRLVDRVDDLSKRIGRLEGPVVQSRSDREPQPSGWTGSADDADFVPIQPESTGDLASAERAMIQATLRQVGGNRRKAARQLGISERTLYRKLKEYGVG